MAIHTEPMASIGNTGAFTSSTGGPIVASDINTLGGAYAISGPTSNQFFGDFADLPALSTPIHSVTVRVRCRVPSGSRTLTVGIRDGSTTYHDTALEVVSTDWAIHDFTWLTNPNQGGAAWSVAAVNDISRTYVRANLLTGTADLHIDSVELVVDHGTTDPEPPAETTIPNVASIYVGAAPVARIMRDGAQIWPTHIPAPVAPSTWAEAYTTRDFTASLPGWFTAHTGHDPALTYETVPGDLTITPAWLTAQQGNGRVSFSGGRWHVERYRVTGSIIIDADDVTLTHMHQDSAGALYGLRSTTNAAGVVVEDSTIAGNGANDNGAALNFPDATTAGQVTLRRLDVSGYRAGLYIFGGITAEYCYVHHLHYSTGSHNTAASIRGPHGVLYRCLLADGNSAAVSMYPEIGPYTGVRVEECALRLPEADTGPELLLAAGRAYSTPQAGDTREVVGCLFYRGGNLGGGGVGGYVEGITTITGNVDRTGSPIT